MNKKKILEVLDVLETLYPNAECELNFNDRFQLIVAVALSAQTTDKSVNKITPKLFEEYPDAYALAEADIEHVAKLIRTIGMYKTKSKNIVNMAKGIVSDYGGSVPGSYDELIKLSGVGRKTANVVLSVGFNEQRIAVDTHVFRVSNRIGMVNESDVLKTEKALMKKVPESRWSRTHHLLIFHGRRCCTARNPNCVNCAIDPLCEKNRIRTK